jgi:hypothetical protein
VLEILKSSTGKQFDPLTPVQLETLSRAAAKYGKDSVYATATAVAEDSTVNHPLAVFFSRIRDGRMENPAPVSVPVPEQNDKSMRALRNWILNTGENSEREIRAEAESRHLELSEAALRFLVGLRKEQV